jgi:hypothetical protein
MSPSRDSHSWFRSSTFLDARIVMSALLLGLLVGVCGVGLDRLVHHASRIYVSDLYTCVVASIFSYLLMIYEKRRRMILARRMAIAAEVNHHIRNALTAIVYSASVRRDQSLQSILKDATDRIDWVLTTVLPDGEERLKWPVQAPEWRPGVWRGVDRVRSNGPVATLAAKSPDARCAAGPTTILPTSQPSVRPR